MRGGVRAGVPSPAATGSAGLGAAPTTLNLTTTSDDGWWRWGEHAKTEFLSPNRLALASVPTTGDDAVGALRDAIGRARRELAPALAAATQDPDAIQRAAACVALARTAGGDAVPDLLARLADANQDVRHAALVGLGLTGSPRAASPLLALARHGSLGGAEGESVSPYARPLAITALAVLRRSGLDEPMLDHAVDGLVREATGPDREAMQLASMLHLALTGSPALADAALALARDAKLPPATRCRAVEMLAGSQDPAAIRLLEQLLGEGRIDLRRSAALALGRSRDPRAFLALERAYRSEAEPLTRGLELISIGRVGGDDACALLLGELRAGERGMRRWAALALGIYGRGRVDAELASAVREAARAERNATARAAYLLASGLLGDRAALVDVRSGLSGSADPVQRAYAATALALFADEFAAATLRAALLVEGNAGVRVAIAHALGVVGAAEDVERIQHVLDGLNEPALQALASTALAWHGTPASLDALRALAASREGSLVRRAASIEGLGVMLARGRPLLLGEFARRTNYTVLPEWLRALLATTV
jgi:HEAT repeat protein